MTTIIWAPTHTGAERIARALGIDEYQWVHGPDEVKHNSFHLIHREELTMGMEYRLSVARASGGKVTTQKVPQ